MQENVRVIKTDFDALENRLSNAISEKHLKTFTAGDGLTSHGKAKKYIESLEPVKLYVGWDGEVYPKYRFETEYAE